MIQGMGAGGWSHHSTSASSTDFGDFVSAQDFDAAFAEWEICPEIETES